MFLPIYLSVYRITLGQHSNDFLISHECIKVHSLILIEYEYNILQIIVRVTMKFLIENKDHP